MHKKVLLLLLVSSWINAEPLLVSVLMVKNEESAMEMTLQPMIDAGIKDYLIYDTGSTDNTIHITREIFQKNNILNYVIEEGEFVDFAVSRNRALELTEQHFPDALFILMLDAEWILHNGSELLDFCLQEEYETNQVYVLQLKGFNIEFGHTRLIRNKCNVRFMGKVHEYIPIVEKRRVPDSVYIELSITHYGNAKSKARWVKDLEILQKELENNPNDARTMYFIAQTYECLSDWKNAFEWYKKRAEAEGWLEETFCAMYSCGIMCEKMEDYDQAIFYYLKAFNICPSRAEPLIRIAFYYYQQEAYELCYIFVRHACTIPYPVNNFGFVEEETYKFLRYNLMSSVAYYIGDFVSGKIATEKALQVHPDYEYLQENLTEYRLMLKEI